MHALDRDQFGLDHPGQIVGDLVVVQRLAGERHVHRRNLLALLQVDHRVFGLRWQLPAHLVDLCCDLGKRLVRILVQLDVGLDHAGPGRAGRGQVVDTLGAGDLALQRRGDEALDQVSIRPEIGGADVHHRIAHLGVLAHVQLAVGAQAEQQDEQADDHRQHRLVDEDVGEFHRGLVWVPAPCDDRGGEKRISGSARPAARPTMAARCC